MRRDSDVVRLSEAECQNTDLSTSDGLLPNRCRDARISGYGPSCGDWGQPRRSIDLEVKNSFAKSISDNLHGTFILNPVGWLLPSPFGIV
jgi:hypothetical protein